MVQGTNLQWIEKFINGMRLYITCEKSGGLHLAEPGLTVGWQAGRLTDEIWARFEILKASCRSKNFLLCLANVLYCFSNFDAFITLFPGKHFYKVVL